MSNDDWFDELLKDVNIRSKQRKGVGNNDIAKNVKIKIKQLKDNAIIVVEYDFKNGTKTLVLYPEQRLDEFLTQITTKRDIDVLKYVVKTLKAYADMNNVLKELMTFDLDNFYENNIKKRRVMLNTVTTNVNNVIQNNATEQQNNVTSYDEQNDINEDNYDEQQNNNTTEQQNDSTQQDVNNYDVQLLQQLRELLEDLNKINLNDVNSNDELYNAVNYVIQRFVKFLIDVNNSHNGVINNVINYLKRHINDGGGE
jgi:thymidylate synthase